MNTECSRQTAFLAALMFTLVCSNLFSQVDGFSASRALEEWRWGVLSLNNGEPGSAELSLEKAVSLDPFNLQIREWLGRSYWKSGLEAAAVAEWDRVSEGNSASLALLNRREELQLRLEGTEEIPVNDEWVPLVSYTNRVEGLRLFERPSSVRNAHEGDSSLLMVSYAGGELIRVDANGAFVERYVGGVEGFDKPFDVLPTGDGRLLVSEFGADTISVLSLDKLDRGYRTEEWGGTGKAENQFLGPQYMALSSDRAFVYISDWGNKRVSKWSLDGEHVLNIRASDNFGGFLGPTGIAVEGERVFVADSLKGTVEVFDPSGNYRGSLVQDGLDSPEGLTVYDNELLVSDKSRVLSFHLESGRLSEYYDLGAGKHKITTVVPDDNGNLAVCDFDGNRVVLLTPLSTVYSGLNVTLDRVMMDAYPDVVMNVSVLNSNGVPLSGLDRSNFRGFIADNPVDNVELDWRSSEDESVALNVIVDSSGPDYSLLLQGFNDLRNSLIPGDELTFIVANDKPVLSSPDATSDMLTSLEQSGTGPVFWDSALRLATTQLVPLRQAKAVVALVGSATTADAFDRFGLTETARFMANNGVIFYPVYTDSLVRSIELDYLAEQTGGFSVNMFEPEGSGTVTRDLRQRSVGRYTLVWRSGYPADFGRAFIPVSVETVYMNKSGRDSSGSFAPLN